uniref:sodium-dependent bicarbonate transport family permease n=1 Tax=Pararhizobium sp. IMCC3301 TaxID=3067904 RepID=UPI0027426CEA|nr:sodium-dependent bicarbonate transport family permease [Pararhizobium sp. IMCC3301]
MADIFSLAGQNLLSPVVLFFVLGLAAALARSDLAIPEQVAKTIALYLMLAIGFKGGAGMAAHGLDARLAGSLLTGLVLSAAIPFVAFAYLRAISRLPRVDAAAVAAHYGSISIVTFVAATEALRLLAMPYEGYMVAVAATMEAPAILAGLFLAKGAGRRPHQSTVSGGAAPDNTMGGMPFREILLNGSIVMLIGAFAIGWMTGAEGLRKMESFIVSPFQGVLALFLLDMGIIAGRGLRQSRKVLTLPVVVFAMTMPVIGALIAAPFGWLLGLSAGGVALLCTLAASSSYIAVPAAMRVALPEARPSIYLTLSLGVTFPFNLTIGIPLYNLMGTWIAG